jgi:hypothetical protein
MLSTKRLRTLVYVIRCGSILLMLTLIGFGIIFILTGNDVGYINQAALQRTRDEIFAKSMYVLQYQPASEKEKAISDLQVSLPLFEQEQVRLMANSDANVQARLQTMGGDYLALDAAVKIIIAHPNDATNSIEINIVLSHELSYLTQINSLVSVLQQESEARTTQLGIIQITIEVVSMALIILLMLLNRHMFTPMDQEEEKEATTLTKKM